MTVRQKRKSNKSHVHYYYPTACIVVLPQHTIDGELYEQTKQLPLIFSNLKMRNEHFFLHGNSKFNGKFPVSVQTSPLKGNHPSLHIRESL